MNPFVRQLINKEVKHIMGNTRIAQTGQIILQSSDGIITFLDSEVTVIETLHVAITISNDLIAARLRRAEMQRSALSTKH